MPGNKSLLSQRKSLPLLISLLLLLTFMLVACGTNSSTTGGSVASTPTTVVTPTPTSGVSGIDSCPGMTPVTTTPSKADVVLKSVNGNKTVDAKKGDLVEIDLAFGRRWEGPDNVSKTLLTEQASYADSSANMCVWRFLTIGTGTAHIDFTAHALCAKGEVCPQYIQVISFVLDIK